MYFFFVILYLLRGRGEVWSSRLPVTQEVAGSNPIVPAQEARQLSRQSTCLKNKGSAVRFCLWPPINIGVYRGQNTNFLKLGQELGHTLLKNPINTGGSFLNFIPTQPADKRQLLDVVLNIHYVVSFFYSYHIRQLYSLYKQCICQFRWPVMLYVTPQKMCGTY